MFRITLIFLLVSSSCKNGMHQQSSSLKNLAVSPADGRTYEQEKSFIDSSRIIFSTKYDHAHDTANKNIRLVITEFLVKSIGNDLYNFWKGTPYDFNGATDIAGQGKIACGFFVTGILKDAGCKLNRRKLSICPSYIMMKALTSSKNIKNLSSLSYAEFGNWISKHGKGVFITGLDFHTGIIINDGTECWFIHSNYINKEGVTKEKITESLALKSSRTRYLTCLTGSEYFLLHWLGNGFD